MVDEAGTATQSLSLRLQKKVAGKLSNRSVAKTLVSDNQAQLLDAVYAALKAVYDKKRAEKAQLLDAVYAALKAVYDKKRAEKTVKGIIKTVAKLGVLEREEQFSPADRAHLLRFQTKFRQLLLTVSSFIQVEYSYDGGYLRKGLGECESGLLSVASRHLTAKSTDRIKSAFAAFAAPEFLDTFFVGKDLAAQRLGVNRHLTTLLELKDS